MQTHWLIQKIMNLEGSGLLLAVLIPLCCIFEIFRGVLWSQHFNLILGVCMQSSIKHVLYIIIVMLQTCNNKKSSCTFNVHKLSSSNVHIEETRIWIHVQRKIHIAYNQTRSIVWMSWGEGTGNKHIISNSPNWNPGCTMIDAGKECICPLWNCHIFWLL